MKGLEEMATNANEATGTAAESTATETAKPKTVQEHMDSRRILPNTSDAIAYLAKCQSEFSDFNDHAIAAPGVGADEEGNITFDPEIYTDEMRVMVAVLTERGEGAGSSRVKAIVVAPVPTLDVILSNQDARQWLID